MITLEGGDELERKFKALRDSVAGDALEASVLAGAEPVLSAIYERAPEGRGILKSDLAAETLAKDEQHCAIGIGAFGNPEAHLVEFGHQLVAGGPLGAGGTVVGQVPPHPFVRPAYDETKNDAVDALGEALRVQIEQAGAR